MLADGSQVPGDLRDLCRENSLRLIVRTDLRRLPVEHPLVSAHPEKFHVRRSVHERGIVDPRQPMTPSGEALARLGPDASEDVVKALCERLASLRTDGIAGIWIDEAERIAPDLYDGLIAAARGKSDFLVLAGSVGTGSFAESRYLICDAGRFAGDPAALSAKVDKLRQDAPVLCDASGAGRNDPRLVASLPLMAALGAGVVAPLEWLDTQRGAQAFGDAVRNAQAASGYDGEVRSLSNALDPIAVIARASGPDLRFSDKALLILANRGDDETALPTGDALSAAAADFGPWDSDGELQPGEVRLMEVRRAPAVVSASGAPAAQPSRDSARLVVEHVEPSVDGGAFPVKRVVRDRIAVSAVIFADGHEQLAAELRWRAIDQETWSSARMTQGDNDRWDAEFTLARMGRHEFVVEGWLDRFGGFQRDFAKKVDAGVDQPVDRAEGMALVRKAAERSKGKLASQLKQQLGAMESADADAATEGLLSKDLRRLMDEADDRPHRLVSAPQQVDAERIEAQFSSWYEIFPRSMTPDPERHGTFADVVNHLPRIRAMGFDTLYFPPIHPIGTANRKGPNNTLTPEEGDPGSPYAIGSPDGGHDAIHPELGSFEDFDRLVKAAADHGLEIALDFAIQASPDHPWLKEHPGWFAWLPDGSMKYAENPPKKYQDIVNVDFYGRDAVPGLWEALRDVILLWVDHGVKTFRVDNPHTKPLPFWEWMIGDVRARHPEVIFLSEAFTRPTMMYQLAKVGFSQSYTYFTWRDRKQELTDYITELTSEAPKDFYRPHFFVNTPDINPFFLQTGGRPAHRIRAVLAATLSGLWGVYSGFELCDATPLGAGKEEYLDSEKYEIRVRDWNAPGNIIEDVTRLNRLRRANPALQTHLNTRFYVAHDENVIWYGKPAPSADGSLREMIMVMVNMDPHGAHACDYEVPLWEFGLHDQAAIDVEDLVHGHRFQWHGKIQHIHLAPDEPYRIWRLTHGGEGA
ncbi:MAG: alpha-1,4-glucan--maltose-1-phosphate maltosyltransferase [Croceicoccus sp.]|nr:alpha-1,4-glucan--maltose-1-phosphate maltosyltransferase [Croceicoccus sp.]MAL25054.1 alpha-1,4-glucan--maltose-1-phosphate maltosyltransferase [Croceicoccus sp.]|tara:strand:+ start:3565 stop:6498 length:2934 start_codon:yes stop_codon:yes gene_type:complete